MHPYRACMRTLLAIFYPKDKLKGMRLHELDLDIVEAITGMYVVSTCKHNEYSSKTTWPRRKQLSCQPHSGPNLTLSNFA